MAVTYDPDLIEGLDLLAYLAFFEPTSASVAVALGGSSSFTAVASVPPGVGVGSSAGTSYFTAAGTMPTGAAAMDGVGELTAVAAAVAEAVGTIAGHAPTDFRTTASNVQDAAGQGRKIRVPKDLRSTKIGAEARTKWRA